MFNLVINCDVALPLMPPKTGMVFSGIALDTDEY